MGFTACETEASEVDDMNISDEERHLFSKLPCASYISTINSFQSSTKDLYYLHYTHLIQVYLAFDTSYRTISKTPLTTIVDNGESISTRFRRYRRY